MSGRVVVARTLASAVKDSGAVKTVHFVRHGEGGHNTATDRFGEWAYYSEQWKDSELTAPGREQATAVGTTLAQQRPTGGLELICTSPLTRTLQTAQLIAAELEPPPALVALEAVRERMDGAQPANARRPLSELRVAYPGVEFSQIADEEDTGFADVQSAVYGAVGEPWPSPEAEPAMRNLLNYGFERQHSEAALAAAAAGADDPSDRTHAAVRWLRQAGHSPLYTEDEPYEDDAGTAKRVASFLTWLAARPEKEVLVSTHCMWLHTLFGRSPPMDAVMVCEDGVDPGYFARGELRTVQLDFSGGAAKL